MRTTCPLDCYDACSIRYNDGKLKGDIEHPYTKGYLCPALNQYLNEPRILTPRFKGKEISMNEALNILSEMLEECKDKQTLYFKGNGNFGMMQNITKEFFSKYGSTFTRGNLCDSGGEAGIIAGRGKNYILPIEEINKSEVVVVWGRNIETTNSHMMDVIKNKILIVIDPIRTNLAKKADIFIQCKPRTDFELAMLFCRFAYIEQMEDEEWIANHASDFDYFLDFFRSYTMRYLLEKTEVVIEDFLTALMLIKDAKVSFLIGGGVQRYTNANEVLRAIDSFVAMMGLFGKEGCGVSFLGDSMIGYENPFSGYKNKTEPMATIDFGKYDLVFVQGANPANQMPNTNRVIKGLKNTKYLIYYGLYENETSQLADLVIPTKNFLEKEDVRFSYGTKYVGLMPTLAKPRGGISEYNLTKYLMARFDYGELKKASKIIEKVIESNSNFNDHFICSKSYDKRAYSQDDFYFEFIEESEDESQLDSEDGLYLLTPKYKYSLNSQFKRAKFVYLSRCLGFCDKDKVKVSSKYGEFIGEVKIDDRLRDDCVLIYNGTVGVNKLTPSLLSLEGDGACFGEVKVKIEKI